MEQADHHNLPMGIVVNQCLAFHNEKVVPAILVNTNNYNIWLWQPLLAAKLCGVEYHPWEYKTILDQERNDNKIKGELDDLRNIINSKEYLNQHLGPGPTLNQKILIYRVKFKGLGANVSLTKE